MTEFNRESNANTLSEAVNSKTNFIEVNEQRFAYRSIGTGLPIILLNRFRVPWILGIRLFSEV